MRDASCTCARPSKWRNENPLRDSIFLSAAHTFFAVDVVAVAVVVLANTFNLFHLPRMRSLVYVPRAQFINKYKTVPPHRTHMHITDPLKHTHTQTRRDKQIFLRCVLFAVKEKNYYVRTHSQFLILLLHYYRNSSTPAQNVCCRAGWKGLRFTWAPSRNRNILDMLEFCPLRTRHNIILCAYVCAHISFFSRAHRDRGPGCVFGCVCARTLAQHSRPSFIFPEFVFANTHTKRASQLQPNTLLVCPLGKSTISPRACTNTTLTRAEKHTRKKKHYACAWP